MNQNKLAELLLPDVKTTPEYYEEKYKPRNLPEGAVVTRIAPSPTGFLHLGTLYVSMIDRFVANSTGGVFYLRIEDTDKKREVKNAAQDIVKALNAFGLLPDEGFQANGSEHGEYGPYKQSDRVKIYKFYAKELIKQGLAYPCFCDEKKLNKTREIQEKEKLRGGYYGKWATCRGLDSDVINDNISRGMPFIIRLRSPGNENNRISFDDVIKGKIEMPENDQDIVLLKSDGIPTYHFAHVIDDYLMKTTHVIRGDEWLASVPIHLQLFRVLGWKPPKYAHVAPIMKEDGGGKRKLSKRKDPEAAVLYYYEQGYPKESVIEYLTGIASSGFEDWRKANKTAPIEEFPFNLKKMSVSGALFDGVKLADVSKNVISGFTADKVYEDVTAWAEQYDKELFTLLTRDPDYAKAIFSIERGNNKPRKDIAKWSDVKEYISYMFDELFNKCGMRNAECGVNHFDVLSAYLNVYNSDDDKEKWFSRIKSICEPLGFSPDVKAYKQNPDNFKGHVGDVSGIIRMAVTGKVNTPDLWAIMRLLGKERVVSRLKLAIKELT